MALKITKNQGSIQVTADNSGFYPFDGTITFPTNSLFTATSANTDMVTFKSTSNGDVQFVGNYKDITISGRSYDTKQKFLTAFSNLANQGSVDAYTKAETDAKIDAKQGKLKAGNGITLTEDATDGTTVVKTAVSLTDNGNGHYTIGDSIKMGDGIAIGPSATSPSVRSIAIGDNASINPSDIESVAIGYRANAAESRSVAIGSNARASQSYGVSIGYQCATDDSSVAIGRSCYATGGSAVAIGENGKATAEKGIAIGKNAKASVKNSVAIGELAQTAADSPLVIRAGNKTVDGQKLPITMIQGDANGKISLLKGDGSDERIVIQDEIEALKNAGGGGTVDAYTKAETDAKLNDKLTAQTNEKGSLFISSSSNDDANNSVALYNSTVKGTNDVAIGFASTPDEKGMHNLAMLHNAQANGNYNIAIGNNRRCDGSDNICIGQVLNLDKYYTIGTGNVCVGALTRTKDTFNSYSVYNSVAIGHNASTNESGSVAIGGDSFANGGYSVAIGNGAGTSTTTGTTAFAVAIGHSARTGGDNPIAIGYNSNSKNGSIAIGYKATSPTLSGIAIGTLATATDTMPLVIKAGTKKVDNKTITQTMIQGDANGKISLLKGDGSDERIVIQDEIAALKAEIAALKGGASTGA